MNIILGQSFRTRSVIPQLVRVIPTRFLLFRDKIYTSKTIFDKNSRTISTNFNQKATEDKNICVLFFGLQSQVSVTVFVSECTRTCTWSSSVTGSEVLVDLSAIRFLLTAIRGLALERSTQNNRVQG